MNILLAFIITMAVLLVSLIKFKVSPGLALFGSAILMAVLGGVALPDMLGYLTSGFGGMMTSIGLIIIFGGVFGMMLGDAGGMEELAKGLLRKVGHKNDLLAMNLAGFIVSIPVYFGSAYIMMAPLVTSLRKLTRKKITSYVAALFTGLLLTHCIVAPTPGPTAVAGQLGANLGWFILYGIIVSLPASLVCGWQYGNFLNSKASKEEKEALRSEAKEFLSNSDLLRADPEKPSALKILLLILFPILLIVVGSITTLALSAESFAYKFFSFVGNNNIALFIALIVTAITLHKYLVKNTGGSVMQYVDKVSDKLGNILMVIGCGGCFGTVLQKCGLGDALVQLMSGWHMPILLLAFLLAMIIRAAVGSATVAMLTTVSIIGTSAVSAGYSAIVVGLAICAGTVGLTLPTDAAFWLPARYNDLTTKDAFIATTYSTTGASVVAFLMVLLLNLFAGSLPGMF